MRILITSGTGNIGRATVRPLQAAGGTVRVMGRNHESLASLPQGVEHAVGDLGNPASVAAALDDVDRVLLITPLHPEEARLGRNVIAAACAASIEYVVMVGVHRAEEAPGIPHFGSKVEIEAALHDSGLAWTVLAPSMFFQNDLWFREPLVDFGSYPQPFGDAGISRVDLRDIAAAAVAALMSDAHEGERYALVGPDVLTATATAELWSKHLGRPVTYAGDDLDAWAMQAGKTMPPWLVDDLRLMYSHFQQRGLAASDAELEKQRELLPDGPRSFEDFVEETARAWA